MLISCSLTDVSSSYLSNNLQHSILATKKKIKNLDFVRGLVSRPTGLFPIYISVASGDYLGKFAPPNWSALVFPVCSNA